MHGLLPNEVSQPLFAMLLIYAQLQIVMALANGIVNAAEASKNVRRLVSSYASRP